MVTLNSDPSMPDVICIYHSVLSIVAFKCWLRDSWVNSVRLVEFMSDVAFHQMENGV